MVISRDVYIRAIERKTREMLEAWIAENARQVEKAKTVLNAPDACIWTNCEYDAHMLYLALLRAGSGVAIMTDGERWIITNKKGVRRVRLQERNQKVDD